MARAPRSSVDGFGGPLLLEQVVSKVIAQVRQAGRLPQGAAIDSFGLRETPGIILHDTRQR